jgi:hypothetical protein
MTTNLPPSPSIPHSVVLGEDKHVGLNTVVTGHQGQWVTDLILG